MRKLYTLLLIRSGSNVLLGYKKRGFGQGKWNGFGGKVNQDEAIEDAAIRELQEECGLKVDKDNLTKIGILSFDFIELPNQTMEVHVFTATEFIGDPEESEEMQPKWFDIDSIPFEEMWLDDQHWFPIFLGGKKFIGEFKFEGQEKIIAHYLKEVDVLI